MGPGPLVMLISVTATFEAHFVEAEAPFPLGSLG